MNIIANNCVGAMLYKQRQQIYNNPFMWSLIPPTHFVDLINNFRSIDLSNIRLIKPNVINVDNRIDVCFPHYKLGDYAVPTTICSDVFYRDISKYVVEKWNSRLNKMKIEQDEPVFIINDRYNGTENGKYVFDNLLLLQKIHAKYKVIFIGVSCPSDVPQNISYVHVSSRTASVHGLVDLIEKSGILEEQDQPTPNTN